MQKEELKEKRICENCRYYADFEGVCTNGNSKYAADYVPYITKCEVSERKVCGNCEYFLNEDVYGIGFCAVYDNETECGLWCKEWKDVINIKMEEL